jgi:hypothetical protein
MSSRLRIVVTGLIAQYPLGGVTWDYVQYVAGLARLGHDVFYIEDTGQWPYNATERGLGKDCTFNVSYLAAVMARFGLADRWAYRFPWQSQWFGLPDARRSEVLSSADLLINVSGTLERPAEYRSARRLVYIDSDPVFTQVKIARGQHDLRKVVDAHDVHFSFGECLGPEVPSTGHVWLPTRQPVLLAEWHTSDPPARDVFTTVMNWTSYNEVSHDGRTYGQKDVELRRFLQLPAAVSPTVLEIALSDGRTRHAPRALVRHHGFQLADPDTVCPDLDSYRNYIQSSRAEWSVAKNGYVVGQSGWFSCRSACYLAAGRPVVVQDTGFGSVLPTGAGILPFSSADDAVSAINDVRQRYDYHARAAREIAESWFDSDTVLNAVIERAFATTPAAMQEVAT